MNIGTHRRFCLPFAAVEVSKGESGERVIEGKKAFVDPFPTVPWTETDQRGNVRRLSYDERKAISDERQERREKKAKQRAKIAAYNALSPEEREKVVFKKEAAKAKRAAKKAEKDAAKARSPHTFVKVIRQQEKFLPPPPLDHPTKPVPFPSESEETIAAKQESQEERKARLRRIEEYKTKPRPAWMTERKK